MGQKLPRNLDLALLLLRLSVGGLMLLHGYRKLTEGIDGIRAMVSAHGLPEQVAFGAYVGEVVGPLLLILGFYTRIAGLFVAFNMVLAIWLGFGMDAFTLNEHGGLTVEMNLLYLFGALALFFSGAGRYSVRKGIPRWD